MDLLAILIKQKDGGVLTPMEEDLIATIDATMNKVKKEKQVSELQERINRCKVEITALTDQHTIKKSELFELTKQLDNLNPKSGAIKHFNQINQSKPEHPWLIASKKSIIVETNHMIESKQTIHIEPNKDDNINWSKLCKLSGFEPGIYKIYATNSEQEDIYYDIEFTRLNSTVELPEGFPFINRNSIKFANIDKKDYYPILAKGGIKLVLSQEFINANR